jgi:hypothetical protein
VAAHAANSRTFETSTTLTFKAKVFRPKSDARTHRTPKALSAKRGKPLRYLRLPRGSLDVGGFPSVRLYAAKKFEKR